MATQVLKSKQLILQAPQVHTNKSKPMLQLLQLLAMQQLKEPQIAHHPILLRHIKNQQR